MNKKYKRSGALFEGKFKAKHADKDEYLKYLFSYIHLNPVKIIDPKWKETGISDKKRAKDFLSTYKYSSYLDYSSWKEREEGNILRKESFPDYFQTKQEFENTIEEWLLYQPEFEPPIVKVEP
jgi:putative transposase